MSRQGRFCPRCHVKVDLEWHPQIPCFCLNKDTKVLSNLFICQLFYVIHVPLHHVRHIHLLLLCQAANMSRKRADKSCGQGKIIPFFPAISQSDIVYEEQGLLFDEPHWVQTQGCEEAQALQCPSLSEELRKERGTHKEAASGLSES